MINQDAVGSAGTPWSQPGRRRDNRDTADIPETQAVSDDYYNDCVWMTCGIFLLRWSDVGYPASDVQVGCLVRMYGLL